MNRNVSDEFLEYAETVFNTIRKLKEDADSLKPEECQMAKTQLEETESFFSYYAEILEKRTKKRENKKQEKIRRCIQSGGHFGKWTERKRLVDGYLDHEKTQVPVSCWVRECSKCGFVEKSNYKPNDLLKNEIDAQIRELQKMKENL